MQRVCGASFGIVFGILSPGLVWPIATFVTAAQGGYLCSIFVVVCWGGALSVGFFVFWGPDLGGEFRLCIACVSLGVSVFCHRRFLLLDISVILCGLFLRCSSCLPFRRDLVSSLGDVIPIDPFL